MHYVIIILLLFASCGGEVRSIGEVGKAGPAAVVNDIEWELYDTYKWVKGHAQSSYNNQLVVASGITFDFNGSGLESQDIRLWDGELFNTIAQLPKNKGYLKGVTEGDTLHLIGGRTPPFTATSEHYTVDLSTGTVTHIADLNDARAAYGIGLFPDGRIIVSGGWQPSPDETAVNGDTIIDTVEMFDPGTQTWSLVAPQPNGASSHSNGVVYNDKFYKFGGIWQEKSADTGHFNRQYDEHVYLYDPSTDTWSQLARMPQPLGSPSVILMGDEVIIMGGHHKIVGFNDIVYVYNLTTDTFRELPTRMIYGAQDNQATLINGKIYLHGGETEFLEPVSSTSDLLQVGVVR